MKKFYTSISCLLLAIFMMLFQVDRRIALAADVYEETFGYSKKMSIDTRSGYRIGSLNWSIAAPGSSPNILSELVYDDLEIYEAGIDAKAVINKIYSRASISFGKIVDGKGIDSDYRENDRKALYSQSESSINDHIQDLCIGLGYQIDFFHKKLNVSPLAGLSYHSQKIRQTDGVQTVSASESLNTSGEAISGLNSTYEAQWRSMFVGFDMDFEIINQIYLSSSLEYHSASYEALANWNLRDDFSHPVSFVHEASGQGTSVNISVNRKFAQKWLIGLMYGWEEWETDPGTDTLHWSGGGTTKSKLNEVNWKSQSVNLSIGYNF